MLQSYDDILQALTHSVRQAHYYHYLWRGASHSECTTFSYDLLHDNNSKRCCLCVASPTWWDENGTPRFMPHHPKLCPDIYASEVALLRISCQCCGAEYDAQMSSSAASCGRSVREPNATPVREGQTSPLSLKVRDGTLHYGDPPCNRCAAGPTMNCWNLRVLEFWSRDRRTIEVVELLRGGFVAWARVPDLEIELPDTRDPERAAP